MATILARKQSNGTTRYTAIVRLRKGAVILHQEAKTFAHRTAAEKWARAREVALENPAALIRATQVEQTLKQLIRWYIDEFQTISKWQRTKQAQLEFLEKQPIACMNALELTPAVLIDHVRTRRAGSAGKATVGNDLTWIGVVLRAAKSLNKAPVSPEIVADARTACRELRLLGKSKRRLRRPTTEELQQLDDYFKRRDARSLIPMRDIMWFAIHSARRESEICRLEARDNKVDARTGMVRDAKHPTAKEGNHREFKYTPEAWEIVQRQPKGNKYIFPYNPCSICSAFTRACRILNIVDLRFHDLRHDATSRLFERGYVIHEVAQFTLHESWNELKRYTNLKASNVREIREAPAIKLPPKPSSTLPTANQPLPVADQLKPRDPLH